MVRARLVYLVALFVAIGTLLGVVARFQLKRHAAPIEA